MSDFITIMSSDNDDVEIVESQNAEPEASPSSPKPSTSKSSEENKSEPASSTSKDSAKRRVPIKSLPSGKDVFTKFLDKCKSADNSSDMEQAIKKLWSGFNQADVKYTTSMYFVQLVEKAMAEVTTQPYSQLKQVYDELKYRKDIMKNKSEKKPKSVEKKDQSDSIDHDRLKFIRKLEHTLAVLNTRIQKLEAVDVDLNSSDEENSAYMQVTRYKQRFCAVFEKLCQLQKKDANADRPLRRKVKFEGTKIPAIDKAIERYYNDGRQFPDFPDILELVKTANLMKKLNLSPIEVHRTAEEAFQSFGKMLKSWRQFEVNEIISSYLDGAKDPAEENTELRKRLDQNKEQFGNKIDEVIDKYAAKQGEENIVLDVDESDQSSNSEEEEDEKEDAYKSDNIQDEITLLESESGSNCDTENEGSVSSDGPCEIPVTNDGVIGIPCQVLLKDIKYDPICEKYNVFATHNGTDIDASTSVDSENTRRIQKRPSTSDVSTEIKRRKIADFSVEEDVEDSLPSAVLYRATGTGAENDGDIVKPEQNNAEEIEESDDEVTETELTIIDEVAGSDDDVVETGESNAEEISESDDDVVETPLDPPHFVEAVMDESESLAKDGTSKGDVLTAVEDDELEDGTEIINLDVRDLDEGKVSEKSENQTVEREPPWLKKKSTDGSSEESEKPEDSKAKTSTPPWLKSRDTNKSTKCSDKTENKDIRTPPWLQNDKVNTESVSSGGLCTENSGSVEFTDGTEECEEKKPEKSHQSGECTKSSSASSSKANNDESDEIMIIDEVVDDKSKKSTVEEAALQNEVIDVEEIEDIPRKPRPVSTLVPVNLSQIIREMKFDSNVLKSKKPVPSTSTATPVIGHNNSLSKGLVQKSSTLGQRFKQPLLSSQNNRLKQQKFSTSHGTVQLLQAQAQAMNRNRSIAPKLANQRRPLDNAYQQNSTMLNNNARFNSANNMMLVQQAHSSQKKQFTTHTTEQHGCNKQTIFTRKQITTVFEESVMQMSGRSGGSGSPTVFMAAQRTTRRQVQRVQRVRGVQPTRNSSVDEVITLD